MEIIFKAKKNPGKIVTTQHFLYFLAAPTLCFQLIYPRSKKIRWFWLAKRLVELVVVEALIILLLGQTELPLIEKATQQYRNGQYSGFVVSLVRHSLPNTYCWLLNFFALFHLFLNITGELLRFGDREFYLDWWNSKNLGEFWRLWNQPVHQWLSRHVHQPLMKYKYSKLWCYSIVFFISGIGHEYIMVVALGTATGYAFWGMFLQMPAIFMQVQLEKILRIGNSNLGNFSFWVSFVMLSQPVIIFLYYLKFYMDYHKEDVVAVASAASV